MNNNISHVQKLVCDLNSCGLIKAKEWSIIVFREKNFVLIFQVIHKLKMTSFAYLNYSEILFSCHLLIHCLYQSSQRSVLHLAHHSLLSTTHLLIKASLWCPLTVTLFCLNSFYLNKSFKVFASLKTYFSPNFTLNCNSFFH